MSSFIEFSYSDIIADSSASSADDIPSVSPALIGVEDALRAGLGDGEDDELRLLDDEPSFVELNRTEVSGEFTPESVEVYSYSTSLSSSRESPSCASSSASGSGSDSESVNSGGTGGVGHAGVALFP